ncbi:uncharacterized protein GLRG_01459 [Colletotrichum graminicola M1.001]|uniref:Uncharacterized protein n=1 Tax=Colletotrichum graminicola (strain M1.001 / M2 / FGSC 10212) TaxID=645133 RepID=E3Q667_COLGM|nr:uncharacterized protein GLRG_01459 [Colletotrichum graminicola M1.001]EFQ26315.1 hypothetical protein GLRG_01459 [Colletotrichum graminicola M1.001]
MSAIQRSFAPARLGIQKRERTEKDPGPSTDEPHTASPELGSVRIHCFLDLMGIDKLRPSLRLWHEDDPPPNLATNINADRAAHQLPRCFAFGALRACSARLTEESNKHGPAQPLRSITMGYKCAHEGATCCGSGVTVAKETSGRQLAARSQRRQANPFFGCRR